MGRCYPSLGVEGGEAREREVVSVRLHILPCTVTLRSTRSPAHLPVVGIRSDSR